jgi:hypothetical protein
MHDYLASHPRRTDPRAPLFPGRSRASGSFEAALDWSSPWDAESFYRYHFKRALKTVDAGACGDAPEVAAKLMGHDNANITLAIYTHLWPEDLTEAVSDLVEPVAATPAPTVVPIALGLPRPGEPSTHGVTCTCMRHIAERPWSCCRNRKGPRSGQ